MTVVRTLAIILQYAPQKALSGWGVEHREAGRAGMHAEKVKKRKVCVLIFIHLGMTTIGTILVLIKKNIDYI
jgi:hypothetical protein